MKESQGICFTGGKNYTEYLSDCGINSVPGYFVNEKGVKLGKHKGILHYTIGQ